MTIPRRTICISAATILVLLLGTLLSFQLVPRANTAHAKSFDYANLNQIQKRILSGYADLELNPLTRIPANQSPATIPLEVVIAAVLQKHSEEDDGRETHLLLSLDCYSKQVGHERNLPHDVSFFHSTHLSFPHHVHHFISL
jgi:hypothetical protein